MKALVITRFGGPEVLELQTVPDAHTGPDQVLIKVEAGGLNFADLMTRTRRICGHSQTSARLPDANFRVSIPAAAA